MAAQAEPTCADTIVHREKIERVNALLPDDSVVTDLAETFKALSDPTRLRIILALLAEELCVHDLAEVVGLSPSAVSHQLRVLRNLKLVKYRKEGKAVYYSLDDEHIRDLIRGAEEHVRE